MVSVAWIEPTMPGSTPRTPASAQLGASSGGGARWPIMLIGAEERDAYLFDPEAATMAHVPLRLS